MLDIKITEDYQTSGLGRFEGSHVLYCEDDSDWILISLEDEEPIDKNTHFYACGTLTAELVGMETRYSIEVNNDEDDPIIIKPGTIIRVYEDSEECSICNSPILKKINDSLSKQRERVYLKVTLRTPSYQSLGQRLWLQNFKVYGFEGYQYIADHEELERIIEKRLLRAGLTIDEIEDCDFNVEVNRELQYTDNLQWKLYNILIKDSP